VTTFLLIRHASHDLLGNTIAGRSPGVSLNDRGRGEAQRLTERLAQTAIAAIYTSPRDRSRETAAPLAARLGVEARINSAIDEIEFGEWTGQTFEGLKDDFEWQVWCENRTMAQPPQGEPITRVQRRITRELERLAALHPDQTVALFTHGDVIKAALARILTMSLDELERFEIAPASVSMLVQGGDWAQVRLINDTGGFPPG
jgi:probable phosphoglycerate mutase